MRHQSSIVPKYPMRSMRLPVPALHQERRSLRKTSITTTTSRHVLRSMRTGLQCSTQRQHRTTKRQALQLSSIHICNNQMDRHLNLEFLRTTLRHIRLCLKYSHIKCLVRSFRWPAVPKHTPKIMDMPKILQLSLMRLSMRSWLNSIINLCHNKIRCFHNLLLCRRLRLAKVLSCLDLNRNCQIRAGYTVALPVPVVIPTCLQVDSKSHTTSKYSHRYQSHQRQLSQLNPIPMGSCHFSPANSQTGRSIRYLAAITDKTSIPKLELLFRAMPHTCQDSQLVYPQTHQVIVLFPHIYQPVTRLRMVRNRSRTFMFLLDPSQHNMLKIS